MAVYCCSDLHGMYNLYEKICTKLKPDDKVYFLGDASDRGPDGWKLIKAILDNPQWIYLKGNHEDMLIKAIFAIQDYQDADYDPYDVRLCYYNGGSTTMEDCLKDNNGFEIIDKLKNLSYYEKYVTPFGVTYWLCHAGYTPFYGEEPYKNVSKRDLIWDREHLHEVQFNNIKDTYIIHGHTPIEYMPEYAADGAWMGKIMHSPYFYGRNMKINIDAGAFYTHETILFNLDEFSYTLIKED